jgi:hypothetical protein
VVTFSSPQDPETTAAFTVPGIYTLRLVASVEGASAEQTAVIAVYDSYPAWVGRHFGAENPLVTGKERDPDRDGLENLLEFALRTDPNRPDAKVSPRPVRDPGENALAITYSPNFVDPATLQIVPEVSRDAQSWLSGPSAVSEQVLADNYGVQVRQAVDLVAASAEKTRYMRLRVICTGEATAPLGLRILDITGAPGAPALSFTSEPAGRYQLEFTVNPVAGWTAVGSPVTASGAVTVLTDQSGATGPFRLYRVRRLP